jgi:hypothetical protein
MDIQKIIDFKTTCEKLVANDEQVNTLQAKYITRMGLALSEEVLKNRRAEPDLNHKFSDPVTQAIYEILCDKKTPIPMGETIETWTAKRMANALRIAIQQSDRKAL